MAKYTMIVTEEDERYTNKEKGLSFFAENPWEGCLNSIVYGDTADELMTKAAKAEGLFYQLYESKTGKLVGRGVVSIDALDDDISEYEKSSIIYIGYLDIPMKAVMENGTIRKANAMVEFDSIEEIPELIEESVENTKLALEEEADMPVISIECIGKNDENNYTGFLNVYMIAVMEDGSIRKATTNFQFDSVNEVSELIKESFETTRISFQKGANMKVLSFECVPIDEFMYMMQFD